MLRVSFTPSVLAIVSGLIAAVLVGGWLAFVYLQEPALEALLLPAIRWRVWHGQPPSIYSVLIFTASAVFGCGLAAVVAGRSRGVEPAVCWKRLAAAHLWLLLVPLQAALLYTSASSTQALAPVLVLSPWLVCVGLAGWLSSLAAIAAGPAEDSATGAKGKLALAGVTFAFCAAGLAILQYYALLVPHGDAGMYEEHLWNLWSGKGFRSQLDDDRLFLGETEVILLMIYMPPCLPTLNICQATLCFGRLPPFAGDMNLSPTCGG